jgi:hypothetical protein
MINFLNILEEILYIYIQKKLREKNEVQVQLTQIDINF